MKDKSKSKSPIRSESKTITVEAQPVSTAIIPQDKSKPVKRNRSSYLQPGSNGTHRGPAKSPLDLALENFLLEEIPMATSKKGRLQSKKKVATKILREPRMRALIRAIYIQAIKGTGKGRLAELIFERVGGKPRQDIYSEELTARFEDPVLRKQRIKELQKTLKTRIST